ncbi:hypothetical protein WJX74_006301 [Apatococcus lobatus]|uniref:Secreted protein n=1 Tax=Apatococcus lobatus TaxID=904363 RepID=A0AAW1RMP9_9CHLO
MQPHVYRTSRAIRALLIISRTVPASAETWNLTSATAASADTAARRQAQTPSASARLDFAIFYAWVATLLAKGAASTTTETSTIADPVDTPAQHPLPMGQPSALKGPAGWSVPKGTAAALASA